MQLRIEHARASIQQLSGPEIETLADYVGQGAIGVQYSDPVEGLPIFHAIPKAYDDVIAEAKGSDSALSMSTDSNRSEVGHLVPMRTCVEFRAGPKPQMTEAVLGLIQLYSDWLTKQKSVLRETFFVKYARATRQEQLRTHYLKVSDFIMYYNSLKEASERLSITSPQVVFHPKNAGPEFNFLFPEDAEWVIKLNYEDLAPKVEPVFFAQYNMSIPIGCVFDPLTKSAFPRASQFSLLLHEKEIAADFNESRPHKKLRAYEQQLFMAAITLADEFSRAHKVPECALGMRDFLRGMVFEIAMISTSQTHLISLFDEEALWIAKQQHKQQRMEFDALPHRIIKQPKASEVYDISSRLSNTLRKSLFSYFMKTTLADFFNQLHPYEKHLLQQIAKGQIKTLCQQAVNLANEGLGNTIEHPSHFTSQLRSSPSFMNKFDTFYEQTFRNTKPDDAADIEDPMSYLTTRFISSSNLGNEFFPVPAVVIELRQPEQGNQRADAIKQMCTKFGRIHQSLLADFYPKNQQSQKELDVLWRKNIQREVKKRSPLHRKPVEENDALQKSPAVSVQNLAAAGFPLSPFKTRPQEKMHLLLKKTEENVHEGALVTRGRNYLKETPESKPAPAEKIALPFFSRKRKLQDADERKLDRTHYLLRHERRY